MKFEKSLIQIIVFFSFVSLTSVQTFTRGQANEQQGKARSEAEVEVEAKAEESQTPGNRKQKPETEFPTRKIRGVVSSTDGVRLPGAEVTVDGMDWTVVTDDTGSFSFKGLPEGTFALIVSCPGFTEKRIQLDSELDSPIGIVLELAQLEFEVTVNPDKPQLMSASENIGVVEVLPSQIATLPSLGEKDLFRSLQLMPGISATNESSSGLYVRGGTPDQNLVLLDGFTVYDVDHFFGIFSAFNANAIDNITMHKGGFESRYGGRLSSVVDLTGNSGRAKNIAVGGGFSFLSFNAYTDAPIGERGHIMFAGRKSYQSPFSDRIRDTYSDADSSGRGPGGRGFGGFSTEPESSFWDINARSNFEITPKDNLVVSFYRGKDLLDNSRTINITAPPEFFDYGDDEFTPISGQINNISTWGNTGVSANWYRNWTDNFFSTFTIAHSRYFRNYDRSADFDTDDQDEEETEETDEEEEDGPFMSMASGSSENNSLKDYTFRFSNFLTLGTQHALEFGAEATQNQIDYHFNFRDDIALFDQSSHGGYYAFYLQDTWHPFPKLSLTSGIRGTYFDGSSRFYGDPRLSIIYHWTDRLRLKGAGGIYHQFVNRLVREDPLQGDQDFWMLSDEDLVPVGSSTHVIGGGSYETDSFLFDVETYWKDLEGLSEFAAFRWGRGRNPADVDLSDRFYSGTGKAKGVEFLAQKKFGQNTGWITYTLGSVDHMFPDISTNFYPASHDSTHEFKIVDSHTWKNFTFSGNWVFASGKPFTEPQGVEEIVLPNERIVELVTLGEKNTSRLPSYHRLDLSATWHFWMGETNKANAGVSIFNAYNNKNVWRKEYDVYEGELIETDVNYLGLTISAFLNVDLSVPSLSQLAGPISSKKSSSKDQESEKKKKKEKIYDFKGTIESIGTNELKINTKWGPKTLIIDDATIKGAPGYDPGTPVHVYYVSRGDQFIVTMVVRVIE